MTAHDTSTKTVTALLEGVTPGPWREFIDDSGDRWTGWPLSIYCDVIEDKTIVRTGGLWPYEWDAKTSQFEACANARFIAAARELVPALSAERDRLAAQVVQLQRNEKLALAQVDRLLALTNKIDDDLQESRKYAEALVQELKDRAIKADVLRDAAQALGAMPEGYCFCSANRIGDDSKTHEPECADLRAALTALEKPHD